METRRNDALLLRSHIIQRSRRGRGEGGEGSHQQRLFYCFLSKTWQSNKLDTAEMCWLKISQNFHLRQTQTVLNAITEKVCQSHGYLKKGCIPENISNPYSHATLPALPIITIHAFLCRWCFMNYWYALKTFFCYWSRSTSMILVFLKVSNLILKQVYKKCLSSNIISHIGEIWRWNVLCSSVCI